MEYLTSFAPAFVENMEMRAALLGVQDSLRQAALLPLEPLGMLACLTAEEEAATFLYYALHNKGYSIPNYGKLRSHPKKVEFVVFAQALNAYFFENAPAELPHVLWVEREGVRPKTTLRIRIGEYEIIQEDPLETIIVNGDGDQGHNTAVESAVDAVLSKITPSGFTIKSHIKNIANRRNFCMYGDPEKKLRLQSESEMDHFKSNCVAMVVLGFLVFNQKRRASSMVKLIENIFDKVCA